MHLIKLIVGIVAIGYLVYAGNIDFHVLSQVLRDNYLLLIVTLIIFLLVTSLGALRWFLLIQAVDVPISLRQCFKIHMIGMCFIFYVPGGGVDLIKAYYIHKESDDSNNLALMSIFIDRAIGIYSLLVVGVISIFINYNVPIEDPTLRWNSWFYIIIFAFSSAVIGFFFTRVANNLFNARWIDKLPFNNFIYGFLGAIEIYREKLIPLFLSFLLSLILHLMMIIVFYFSALALNLDIPFSLHVYLVPLLLLINIIPITPGGLGVGEVASFALYNMAGVKGGGEIFLLFHAYLFINSALGVPFYFMHKKKETLN